MKVGLGLGSNLGDRLLNLQNAKNYLLSLSPERWHVQSPVYETEPVGCPPGSPKFFNAVLEIEFTGAPRTLLKKILAYEIAHGRDRTPEPTPGPSVGGESGCGSSLTVANTVTPSSSVGGESGFSPPGRGRGGLPLNAPRTIDIDILYFGEKEVLEKDLVIPHPRIAQRRFVLLPLSTIRPEMIVKGTARTVKLLLRELPAREGEVTFVQQEW